MKKWLSIYWPIIPALVLYAALADHLNFTQDDAYISYRYVANFLNGDGLVYNIGERIEGFTNFGWVIFMIFCGILGLDFIVVSKITGFLLGAGVVWLSFVIARSVFDDRSRWFAVAATYLVAVNPSLAYWSPAGLETAAFAFFAMLSLYFYLTRNWMLIFSLLMAVWMRPEGAVLTGILILVEVISHRRVPRFTLMCAASAFVLSLPFVFFKLFYYGGILPNPFYAKTSFTIEQLTNGLEYAGRYFSHYGFLGLGFLVPLLFWKRLGEAARAIWLYTVIYCLYIVLIGGDVLKVHRFFLPLFGPAAIMVILSIRLLVQRAKPAVRYLILTVVSVALLALTYELPKAFVGKYNFTEKAFVRKQQTKAQDIKNSDDRNFSVALATIGIFGYELLGHEIIDLVGLTDSTIARYSEDPIPGMETTWKEQKHNSKYLLQKAPDYIVFSTGVKPSAPAERALLLYRQFLDCYRSVGWFYRNPEVGGMGIIAIAFKKMHPVEGEIIPVYPVKYVQYYKLGLDAHSRGDHKTAVKYYDLAIQASPEPYNLNLLYQRGYSLLITGQMQAGEAALDSVVARDSTVFESHKDLYLLAMLQGNYEKAEIHKKWLLELVPWYWPRVEAVVNQRLRGGAS